MIDSVFKEGFTEKAIYRKGGGQTGGSPGKTILGQGEDGYKRPGAKAPLARSRDLDEAAGRKAERAAMRWETRPCRA